MSSCPSEAHSQLATLRSGTLPAALQRGLATLLVWLDRSRQRRHLARLDDRLLKDIGLDRATAERETAKPFWAR